MAQANLRGVGGRASAILTGGAAVATVVAAILGILSQFGLITSHDTAKTVAVAPIPGPPPVSMASVAPVAAAPAEQQSLVAHASQDRRLHAKPQPPEVVASARVAVAEPAAQPPGAAGGNSPHPLPPGQQTASPAHGATEESALAT